MEERERLGKIWDCDHNMIDSLDVIRLIKKSSLLIILLSFFIPSSFSCFFLLCLSVCLSVSLSLSLSCFIHFSLVLLPSPFYLPDSIPLLFYAHSFPLWEWIQKNENWNERRKRTSWFHAFCHLCSIFDHPVFRLNSNFVTFDTISLFLSLQFLFLLKKNENDGKIQNENGVKEKSKL